MPQGLAPRAGGGITSSKGASKSSKDDDGKTSTELVTEAISKGLKQDRTLRAKANANKGSTLWWLLTQIKDLLIKFGIGNLTKWQVTTILLGTYFLWPKLKPNMRLLLNRMYLQVLSARDMIVSKVATHLIGLTTTGLTLALASRNNSDTDEDPEPSAAPAVTRAAPAGTLSSTNSAVGVLRNSAPFVDLTLSADNSSRSTTPLSPISESPASRRTPVADIETGLESDNESVPSLEEPSPEANKPEAGAASSPSAAVSQWQSNVKPTESGDAAVQDAQAAQVQPEVPLLSDSASMNTLKLAAPINVSRKITRTVMFSTSSGIPSNAMVDQLRHVVEVAIIAVPVEGPCSMTASVHDELGLLIARWLNRGE